MASHKRRAERDDLFGMRTGKPEWEQQRDDARAAEVEKTQRLREMRLAAPPVAPKPVVVARPAAPSRATAKPRLKPRRIARAS